MFFINLGLFDAVANSDIEKSVWSLTECADDLLTC